MGKVILALLLVSCYSPPEPMSGWVWIAAFKTSPAANYKSTIPSTSESVAQSGRPEFVGEWVYSNYVSPCNDQYESWDFDSTVKAFRYYDEWYSSCSVWLHDGYFVEWRIDGSNFCWKPWGGSVWTCKAYSLSGNTLTIGSRAYRK